MRRGGASLLSGHPSGSAEPTLRARVVRLIVAHRILIGTAIAFGFFFTGWEVVRYARTGQLGQLLIAGVTALVTLGLGYYLKNLKRFVQ